MVCVCACVVHDVCVCVYHNVCMCVYHGVCMCVHRNVCMGDTLDAMRTCVHVCMPITCAAATARARCSLLLQLLVAAYYMCCGNCSVQPIILFYNGVLFFDPII